MGDKTTQKTKELPTASLLKTDVVDGHAVPAPLVAPIVLMLKGKNIMLKCKNIMLKGKNIMLKGKNIMFKGKNMMLKRQEHNVKRQEHNVKKART
jgi:hypothetical protein